MAPVSCSSCRSIQAWALPGTRPDRGGPAGRETGNAFRRRRYPAGIGPVLAMVQRPGRRPAGIGSRHPRRLFGAVAIPCPGGSSGPSSCPCPGGGPRRPRIRSQDPSRLLRQHRNLICDLVEIGIDRREHRQARSVADRHDHQHPLPHGDQGLGDRAAVEHRGGPLGQADEAGGDRGEALKAIRGYPLGHRQRHPVGGHDGSMSHIGYALGEVGNEPAEILHLAGGLTHGVPLMAVIPRPRWPAGLRAYGWSSEDWALAAVARARREPRWKPASRLLMASAESVARAGLFSRAPAEPGTRLAWGVRRGSPAAVTPPTAGATTLSAARQPSSPGDVQAGAARWGSSGTPARGGGLRRARNQSDSTDSKIGSRISRGRCRGSGTTNCCAPACGSPGASPAGAVTAGASPAGASPGDVVVSGASASGAAANGAAGSATAAAGSCENLAARVTAWTTADARSVRMRSQLVGLLSSEISASGSHTWAMRPTPVAFRSRTLMPCRSARCATANRPMWRETSTSAAGGFSSRQFTTASCSSVIPIPLSTTLISTPPLLSE